MSDLVAFVTARLGEDEEQARLAAREVAARRRLIGEQTSDHAPIESIYGTVCRTCVTWQDAPLAEGGETEFGIAIPQDWPCRVARAEAAKWADHAHFDPSWALSE